MTEFLGDCDDPDMFNTPDHFKYLLEEAEKTLLAKSARIERLEAALNRIIKYQETSGNSLTNFGITKAMAIRALEDD